MELNYSLSDKAQQDIELVNRARKGDEKAYAQLLGRYRDAIYFMLLKMVNNPVDAEDLTIEAFGKAFKNLNHYEPDFAFSTWLFKIANNNAIDFIRKQKGKTVPIDSPGNSQDEESTLQLASNLLDPEEELIK